MLAAIDGELAQLRGHLELQGDEVQLVSRDKVLRTAAAIESTAEFISADLNRFSSQLFPQTYRETVLYAASDFMQSAKLFHQAVDASAEYVHVVSIFGRRHLEACGWPHAARAHCAEPCR